MWACFKFWPMKNIFRKLYKPMRVWLWLVYKFTKNYCPSQLFWVHSNSEEVSYLSWQNTYPNLKTTCHIKLKFSLWTKLLENLLLTKYLISVTLPLIYCTDITNFLFWIFWTCLATFIKKIIQINLETLTFICMPKMTSISNFFFEIF